MSAVALTVEYIEDNKPGLDHLDVLLAALKRSASNGGDTRCLCRGCLVYWSLKHLTDVGA